MGVKRRGDRVLGEGEGGGAWRPHHKRIGIPIRRASDTDRALEAAVSPWNYVIYVESPEGEAEIYVAPSGLLVRLDFSQGYVWLHDVVPSGLMPGILYPPYPAMTCRANIKRPYGFFCGK